MEHIGQYVSSDYRVPVLYISEKKVIKLCTSSKSKQEHKAKNTT